jgi:hypothetical protein
LNVKGDLLEGNMGIEVFESPSGKSAMYKVLKWSGVQNAMKNAKRQFLRFGGLGAQDIHKRFINRFT